jgi:uncharacterized protein (TIGR03437 family)
MRTCIFATVLIALGSIPVLAQPTIAAPGAESSATYFPPGLPNSGIAQGSIFVMFGSGLGPTTLAQVQAYPLTATLAGTSVKITVNGTSTDALMIYTSAGQLAAILPSSTPVGTGTVTVTFNGQTSATAPITVVANNFGIYTLSQDGGGPAVITTPGYKVNTLTATAKPGDVLILWGTGLGPYSGDETNPPAETGLPVNVTVYVGDKSAKVSYKGRSSSPGLDQINFTVPAGLGGCYVPVAVVVNGTVSNFTSMSISADGSTCSDPAGLPSTAINGVVTNGHLKVGFIELQRIAFSATVPIFGTVNIKQDRGAAYFYNFDDQSLIRSRGLSSISSFGACTVLVCSNSTSCIPDNTALNVPRLDVGSTMTITGPNGAVNLPASAKYKGEFHGPLGATGLTGSNYLDPGDYTASDGSGGPDVGAFVAKLTIASLLKWTNQSAVLGTNAIDRNKDLTIDFSGGNPDDYVAIVGSSTSAPVNGQQSTVTFVCTEKASVGSFTIPSFVLSALPASGNITISGISGPGGFLLVGNYPLSNTFSATGLDLGYFSETVVSGINIPYQ